MSISESLARLSFADYHIVSISESNEGLFWPEMPGPIHVSLTILYSNLWHIHMPSHTQLLLFLALMPVIACLQASKQ